MKILVKSLIVWLMLVAIPFQGFASASMLMCAPAQVAAPAMSMEHDHHAMMQAMQHDSAAQPAGHDAAKHHHDGGKCNSCASCCFGAAMAPSGIAPRVPAEAPQPAAFHFEPGHVATVDLALPERPPQASLT